MTEEVRTYEIVTHDGTYRLDVPVTARVTYGPVIGAAGKSSYGATGNVLRIWEGTKANEVQRALFQNVTAFRDLSLPMRVRAVRRFGSEDWFLDDGRTWVGPKADQVERAWKNADEIKNSPMPPDDEPSEDDGSVSIYPRAATKRGF
jgi:hypothetical protein